MGAQEAKSQLRRAIKERLARLGTKDRAVESRSLCKRILESLPEAPVTICAFHPMGDEVDIRSLFTELLVRGYAVYLPRKEGKHFVFRKMESLERLQPDDFRIPSPPEDAPLLEPGDLALALIPGRAFDRKGNRMGRGNGGYDIWIRKQRQAQASLPAEKKAQFWGVALECQIVQEVPMEAHDETVDLVITPRGSIKNQRPSGEIDNRG